MSHVYYGSLKYALPDARHDARPDAINDAMSVAVQAFAPIVNDNLYGMIVIVYLY